MIDIACFSIESIAGVIMKVVFCSLALALVSLSSAAEAGVSTLAYTDRGGTVQGNSGQSTYSFSGTQNPQDPTLADAVATATASIADGSIVSTASTSCYQSGAYTNCSSAAGNGGFQDRISIAIDGASSSTVNTFGFAVQGLTSHDGVTTLGLSSNLLAQIDILEQRSDHSGRTYAQWISYENNTLSTVIPTDNGYGLSPPIEVQRFSASNSSYDLVFTFEVMGPTAQIGVLLNEAFGASLGISGSSTASILLLTPDVLNTSATRLARTLSNSSSGGALSLTSDSGVFPSMTFSQYSALSAAPEPATWVMMIAGFGLVGAAMRHRKASENFV